MGNYFQTQLPGAAEVTFASMPPCCGAILPSFMMFHTSSLFFRARGNKTNESAEGYYQVTFSRQNERNLSLSMASAPELINELRTELKFGALALVRKDVKNCRKIVVHGAT